MAKAKSVKAIKIKKKSWVTIIAPKMFSNQIIGETFVAEPEKKVGMTVSVSLSTLTGDMKRQSTHIIFKINNYSGGKLGTEIIGYEISPSAIKRMVRRDKEKLDHSFPAETADGRKIRLKWIMITKEDTKSSILSALRKSSQDFLVKEVKKMSYDDLVNDIISHKVQAVTKKHLTKVYPLQICEIRAMVIEGGEAGSAAEEVKAEEPKAAEETDVIEEAQEEADAEEEKEESEEAESEDNISEEVKE